MIDDLYLSTNQTEQKVYVVIEERFVPYELCDRTICGVFTSKNKANNLCNALKLVNGRKQRYVQVNYEVEEHEVQ